MMYGYGMTGGFGFGWIFMILWWAVLIGGVIALVRWLGTSSSRGSAYRPEGAALDILKERYARGEIDREQFQKMKSDLLQ